MTHTANGFGLAPTTYKRAMVAFGIVGGLALGLGAAIERPFVGVGVYVLAMTAAVAVPRFAEYTLFDERDDAIHRRASGITLALFGWLAAIVFPSLVVLSTTPYFAWGPASTTLAFATAAVYLTYLSAIGYYAYR